MEHQIEEGEFLVKLRTLIANVLDLDEELIGYDTKFIDDLGVDSLVALELMVTLEREYGLKLTEEDLRQMMSLRNVHDFLLGRLNSRRSDYHQSEPTVEATEAALSQASST